MSRKKLFLILSIMLMYLLCGCTAVESPRELMKRPESMIFDEDINKITEEFLTSGKVLTFATAQMEKGSIRNVDIDNDGQNELLILYKENKDTNLYGVLILKKKDNKWYQINKINQGGQSIDFFDYKDITGDNKPELFLGCRNSENNKNHLYIYSYDEGYFHSIDINMDYEQFGVYDINNDKQNEIILLHKNDEDKTKELLVFKYDTEDIAIIDKFKIYNNSIRSNMTIGDAGNGYKGIFIDFYIDERSGYTDLFILKDDKIIDVLENEKGKGYLTFEINKVKSKDINNDEIIEIGLREQLKKTEEMEIYDVQWIQTWYQWNGKNDLKLVKREYYNYDSIYKIDIPDYLKDEFTIIKKYGDNFKNKNEFYTISKGKLDKLIMSIISFNREQWNSEKNNLNENKYIILKEDEETVIIAELSDEENEKESIIDKEEIIKIFNSIK